MQKLYVIIAALLSVIMYLAITFGCKKKPDDAPLPAETRMFESRSLPTGAVVTNGHECATIGGLILRKGGSAVDAAIAALFCEGVAIPHAMGVGGGFLMTIYNRENKTARFLNARECAPSKAAEDMFVKDPETAVKGGLAVAVPGEILGYWYAHQKYGVVNWRNLIQPTIRLCKIGTLVTEYVGNVLNKYEKEIQNSNGLRRIFINPKTKKVYKKGDHIKRRKFRKTLKIIARRGPNALYNGELTRKFIYDIKVHRGIISAEDLWKYKPKWEKPITAELPDNQTLYTAPLPGSGIILTFILNILNGFLNTTKLDSLKNWQRIVESLKHGYGRRTQLGDPTFVPDIEPLLKNLTSPSFAEMIRNSISDTETYKDPNHYGANISQAEDHGTAHLTVLASNGDAVSVTSTINLIFGAGIVSGSTGIILNNQMDDFSSPNITNAFEFPPSPANFIRPGKRPLSSMCPSVILDQHGDVVLVIGAAGGSKITATTVLVTLRYLWFNQPLKDAVSAGRLYNQLFPPDLVIEDTFDKKIADGLAGIGHLVRIAELTDGFTALTAIGKRNYLEAVYDTRRGGSAVFLK